MRSTGRTNDARRRFRSRTRVGTTRGERVECLSRGVPVRGRSIPEGLMGIRVLAIACLLSASANPAAAQPRPTANDGQRANLHYRAGWELLSKESWAGAAAEFQAAIDIDARFKL